MGLHSKSGAEKVGFWLTIICGIHCIATPILITLLPIIGSKFDAFHKYEIVFLYFSLFLALYLMWKDQKIHKNIVPFQMIVFAIFISIIGNLYLGKTYEIYVSVSLATIIISAYWLNWKHKERCSCEHVH